jgi:two-component system CheB/CheR fusion protein
VIVPEDKVAFQKIEESRLNHNVYEVDYRIARANDGEIVWIKSTGHYHYDEFGIAHTLTGVSIDIQNKEDRRRIISSNN